MTTSAVSVRFWLSVTVSLRVIDPVAGARTEADALLEPKMTGGLVVGDTTVQAWDTRLRLQAAALPAAFSMTV
jgi:hypothetical protein